MPPITPANKPIINKSSQTTILIAVMIINIAKAFLKYLDDIRCNRNAPNRAPIVSPAPTLRIILVSIWPFLKYIKVLTIVNGKIIEIAVEWASCSFNFRK